MDHLRRWTFDTQKNMHARRATIQQRLHQAAGTITFRLVAIAVVPALMMSTVLLAVLYLVNQNTARTEVRERGKLTAVALAESSRHAVQSGDRNLLRRTLGGVLAADRSIAAIEVRNAKGDLVVRVGADRDGPDDSIYETRILIEQRAGDALSSVTNRSASSPGILPADDADVLGHVRVVVSPTPIYKERTGQFLVIMLGVAFSAVISGVLGLSMAQRLREPLVRVVASIRQVQQGLYASNLPSDAQGELGDLMRTINAMGVSLRAAREDLEAQVRSRTAQLEQAIAEVGEANEERGRLIARANDMIEEERRRLAIEIHDHLNASLVFIKHQLNHIKALSSLPAARTDAPKQVHDTAETAIGIVDQIYGISRTIIRSLRPVALDLLGLQQALNELVTQYDSHATCKFHFEAEGDIPEVPTAVAIALYRVTQEALTNVIKHAEARNAWVSLHGAPHSVRVKIRDDGKGFDVAKAQLAKDHLGLAGMRERVRAADGKLTIHSGDSGSLIEIMVALPAQAAATVDETAAPRTIETT